MHSELKVSLFISRCALDQASGPNLVTWRWVTSRSNSQLKMSDQHWDREATSNSDLNLALGQPNEWWKNSYSLLLSCLILPHFFLIWLSLPLYYFLISIHYLLCWMQWDFRYCWEGYDIRWLIKVFNMELRNPSHTRKYLIKNNYNF